MHVLCNKVMNRFAGVVDYGLFYLQMHQFLSAVGAGQ